MKHPRYKVGISPVKYTGPVISGLCLSAVSGMALANCSFYNGVSSELNEDLSFGSVIVQRDSPVGTVLATAYTGSYHAGHPFFGCTIYWTYRWEKIIFTDFSPLGGKIYNTNIDGVGIVVSNPANSQVVPYDELVPGYSYVSIPGGMRAQLIKTKSGAVGAGQLTTGVLARASVATFFYTARVTLVGVNTIIPVACSVTNSAINVPMGNSIPMTAFTGPGSSAAETPFAIDLNCDANTRVQLKLEGIPHASGVEGVLTLNASPSDTVASGIGLQVLHNNVPVKLATEIAVGTVASDGPYSIPLTARYYQTGAGVSGGVANSTATFTLTYN